MEINEYRPKHNKFNKAASEYEASQVRAQHIKLSGQDQKSIHINKNEHTILRGEIIDLRYQEVKIRLEPSGQIISAKLTGEVPLSIGQTAEFVVSDETNGLITLRYISTGNFPTNNIIEKALYASGLSASERNLNIVQELLNHKMPVDKSTILQLIKLTSTYPDVSPTTLILMHKSDLPINIGSIAQFEAYQNGMHQILNQLKTTIIYINSIASDDNIEVKNHVSPDTIMVNNDPNDLPSEELISTIPRDISSNNTHLSSVINLHKELLAIIAEGEGIKEQISPDMPVGDALSNNELMPLQEMLINKIDASPLYSDEISGNIKSQITDGTASLESLLTIVHDLFVSESSQPHIDGNMLPARMVEAFIGMSEQLPEFDKKKLVYLLKSDSYREIITEALHSRWTIKPSELTQENKVKEFFRRLDKDLEQLNKLTENFKLSNSPDFKLSVNKLQDNLQFMRELNELFLYLQLPIRLTEQDVHGDLYVFTRKHQKHNDSEGLNILLHLDMANLGPIDIHMSMMNSQINAVFYLDKSSEQLISMHLHELTDTLLDKGYQLQAKTQITDSKPDFIIDILQPDTPGPNTHRYSFDIRA